MKVNFITIQEKRNRNKIKHNNKDSIKTKNVRRTRTRNLLWCSRDNNTDVMTRN